MIFGAPSESCRIPYQTYRLIYAKTFELLERAQDKTGVKIISFEETLCKNDFCENLIDGKPVYVDAGHLTYAASSILAQKANLKEILLSR